jgi:site-specific DNA-adenine methylase
VNKTKIHKLMNVWPFTKTWGGKWYQRKRLLSPAVDAILRGNPFDVLFDGFGGGGTITQNASFIPTRVYNELDWFKFNFFERVQDDALALRGALEQIPYEESVFKSAKAMYDEADRAVTENPDLVDSFDDRRKDALAVAWFIQSRMSRCGLGEHFGIGTRTRGGKPGDINAYENVVAKFVKTAEYWRGVHLWNHHFRFAIPRMYNHQMALGRRVLRYFDPPYLPTKRVTQDAYRKEMTHKEHEEMAALIVAGDRQHGGCTMISGYDSEEYDSWFKGYQKIRYTIDSKVGQTKVKAKKVECVWGNFDIAAMVKEQAKAA